VAKVVDYPPRCYRSGVDWACHLTDGDGDEFHAVVLLTFPWAEKRPGATLVNAAHPDEKWLYRVGGLSALTLGTAYIIIIPLFARVGAPPRGEGEVWLQYLQGKTTVWWTILSLCVLTDFLYIPVSLALYFALERVNRSAMLLASVFVGLFVALDLAVTWVNYAALITLSSLYAAVPNEVQRAGYVAAANYASAVLASPAEVFYAIVDLSIGIFIISFVMLRNRRIFNRTMAYLGVAAGIFGFISVGGFFIAVMLHTVLITIWFLLVGYRLCGLGWNHSDMNPALRGVSQAVD
jgi:hypothetical protein